MKRIIFRIVIVITLISGSLPGFAQQDSGRTTLTLAAIYSTNADYYGQKAAEKLPYLVANATIQFPSGIYFSGMAYKLLDHSEGIVSASSLSAGYGFKLSKTLSADLSYSHTFFPANSPFLQVANANTASGSLSLAHLFTTGITADYAFGKEEDIFLTLSNSHNFNLGSLFGNDLVSLSPSIDVIAGTTHFYKTYVTEKQRRDSLLGLPVFNPFPGNSGNNTNTTSEPAQEFSLFSYNLKLPLAYSRSGYMLEASYQLSLLQKDIEASKNNITSFFNFSFYYQF